ncbi:TPA: hypothetical protein IHD35_000562 [Escherichia coli]|uniref:hypothetical protein n=1 Tax=Lelliottia amnigena TaxID=61646 RepID=UPI0019AF8631|nr:hypothetical protein [Lelliottia amnigena]MCG7781012.1 hypothetical protein [Lelliottia amnigena]HAO1322243.1 hypothetical protein [Escherichia coli]
MSGEIAKYRVLRLSHIHNNLWPEGSEVEYEGEPGTALEPLNDAAKAAKAKAKHKGDVVVEVPAKEPLNDGGGDDDLDKLREEYELLFNEKPHPNTGVKTLREKIAEKRAELGV